VRSLLQLADVTDGNGKVVHSKLTATIVMIATIALLATKRIETEPEAFVLITLIGVAFGHDWGKSFLKSKFPTNGDTSDSH
jgi:hypothetical protein